jgi:UDPglucose 6-dehydrogenase
MIPNGNVDDVVGFLGLDGRIGGRFLQSGTGAGGPCLPRDPRAFIAMGKELGIECPIQQAVDDFNRACGSDVAMRAMSLLRHPSNTTVSILGLTYKPNTNVIEESASLTMIRVFCKAGLSVRVFDPAGIADTKKELGDLNVEYAKDIEDCLKNSDLCVLATPWDEFKVLRPQTFLEFMRKPVVLDCWRVWDRERFVNADVEYHAVGVNI